MGTQARRKRGRPTQYLSESDAGAFQNFVRRVLSVSGVSIKKFSADTAAEQRDERYAEKILARTSCGAPAKVSVAHAREIVNHLFRYPKTMAALEADEVSRGRYIPIWWPSQPLKFEDTVHLSILAGDDEAVRGKWSLGKRAPVAVPARDVDESVKVIVNYLTTHGGATRLKAPVIQKVLRDFFYENGPEGLYLFLRQEESLVKRFMAMETGLDVMNFHQDMATRYAHGRRGLLNRREKR